MKNFIVIYYNNDNKISKKKIQANDLNDLENIVVSDGIEIVSIKEVSKLRFKEKHLNKKELLRFTEQVDVLLQTGLNFHDAVRLSISSLEHSNNSNRLNKFLNNLLKGGSLYNLLTQSNLFPDYYVEIVSIGEQSNSQSKIFHELAIFLKNENEFNDKLVSVVIYPLFIIIFLIVGSILFIELFLPNYLVLMEEFVGKNIEIIEKNIMLLDVLVISTVSLIITLLGIYLASYIFLSMRAKIHYLLLKLPLIKDIILLYNLTWGAFLIKCLLEGGEKLSNCFLYTSKFIKNSYIAESYKKVGLSLQKGLSPSQAFQNTPIFPNIFCQWLEIGEFTQDKTIVFDKIYSYFKYRYSVILQLISTLIQPVVMLCVGIGIIMLIRLLIIPLFQLYTYI